MKESKSPLAGEMSGHIFFADKYYGFDDALYAAVRLIDILSSEDRTLGQIIDELPKTHSTAEIRIDIEEELKFKTVDKIKSDLKKSKIEFNDVDGIRAKNKDGWWLLRASNTQAVLVARCEANSQSKLEKLKSGLADILKKNKVSIPEELSKLKPSKKKASG
jgi:phosphomannomutase